MASTGNAERGWLEQERAGKFIRAEGQSFDLSTQEMLEYHDSVQIPSGSRFRIPIWSWYGKFSITSPGRLRYKVDYEDVFGVPFSNLHRDPSVTSG